MEEVTTKGILYIVLSTISGFLVFLVLMLGIIDFKNNPSNEESRLAINQIEISRHLENYDIVSDEIEDLDREIHGSSKIVLEEDTHINVFYTKDDENIDILFRIENTGRNVVKINSIDIIYTKDNEQLTLYLVPKMDADHYTVFKWYNRPDFIDMLGNLEYRHYFNIIDDLGYGDVLC